MAGIIKDLQVTMTLWQWESKMDLRDEVLQSSRARSQTTSLKNCIRGERHETTKCLKPVVGVSKDMLPVKYLHSNMSPSLCRSNVMEIISLSQS